MSDSGWMEGANFVEWYVPWRFFPLLWRTSGILGLLCYFLTATDHTLLLVWWKKYESEALPYNPPVAAS